MKNVDNLISLAESFEKKGYDEDNGGWTTDKEPSKDQLIKSLAREVSRLSNEVASKYSNTKPMFSWLDVNFRKTRGALENAKSILSEVLGGLEKV